MNLAFRDIRHKLGRFVLTCLGLSLLLGVVVIIITGIPLIIADKLIGGGDGTAGIAASSSAGAAVAGASPPA